MAAATSSTTARNPRDSMKSTWREEVDRKSWGVFHYAIDSLKLYSKHIHKTPPVFAKTTKVPYAPQWQAHAWILMHSLAPVLIQQVYQSYTGRPINMVANFFLYFLTFQLAGIHQIHQMRRLGEIYGYLDGDKHARDDVPDVGVVKVFTGLFNTTLFRTILHFVFESKSSKSPSTINWLALFFEVGLYQIVLDFWFYWYHRAMHQYDHLWKYHRTHHLTKHPNPLLTLYADEEQEFFDIVGIPLMAWATLKVMGFPMGFHEWWLCNQYCVYSELLGHSGLRVSAYNPSPFGPLLRYFHADLAIEDHDLHHRTGWKKSHNYGKQTRLWDLVFGTTVPRLESAYENIDYDNTANMFLGFFGD